MNRRLLQLAGIVGFFAVCGGILGMVTPPLWHSFSSRSTTLIEARLRHHESLISGLARCTTQTGVGAIGYRSASHDTAGHVEWVQVDLGGEHVIDAIALVPTLYRTPDSTVVADGFPRAFRVILGTDNGEMTLAAYSTEDELLPRVAPLLIECSPITVSWVRLEASQLSPRVWDGRHILQLSEILVFTGEDNIALGCGVTASSSDRGIGSARHERFLTDGFVPYLMDAADGAPSQAFVSEVDDLSPVIFTLDLEDVYPLDRIHLHAIDVSDNVPQSYPNDFGMPRHILAEAATTDNFADARWICEFQLPTALDSGPIIARRFPSFPCRFLRLTLSKPFRDTTTSRSLVGFAEIEGFANGRNVTASKTFVTNIDPKKSATFRRSLTSLTDRHNIYGSILPLRQWVTELAERHDLERESPRMQAEIDEAYRQQSLLVNRLVWMSISMVIFATGLIVTERFRRRHAIQQTKKQIAADLHDELGADLHALALCCDLARANHDQPAKLESLLDRIRSLSDRSGAAAKACVDLLESRGLYDGLVVDLRRTAERLLVDLDHHLSVVGEPFLAKVPPRLQIGISLFYRECLTNILRHSGATVVATHLIATPRELILSVVDNGSGLRLSQDSQRSNAIPPALKRRGRLLRAAAVTADTSPEGTRITLRRRIAPWWTIF